MMQGREIEDSPPVVWSYERNTKYMWRLDVSKQELTRHVWAEMPYNFRACSWVNLDRATVLLCGGIENGTSSQVWKFTYSSEPAWTNGRMQKCMPMNTPRHSFAIYRISTIVYAFGGYDMFEECECYDTAKDQWAILPRIPFQCGDGSAVRMGYNLYVTGDATQIGKFDPIVLSWTVLALELPDETKKRLFTNGTNLYIISNDSLKVVKDDDIKLWYGCTNPLEWMPGIAIYHKRKVYLTTEQKKNLYYFDLDSLEVNGVERNFFDEANPNIKPCFPSTLGLDKIPNSIFEAELLPLLDQPRNVLPIFFLNSLFLG
jgi:hypothetical protein